MSEPLLSELSRPGRTGALPPEPPGPDVRELLPADWVRSDGPDLPELSQPQVVRHFVRLSRLNYSVDTNFYPLGSCTMKHNPKINEEIGHLPGFLWAHPLQPASTVQGAIEMLYRLQEALCRIAGMDAFTLQPAAGAHGELTGLMMVKRYFQERGESRTQVLVPDNAHGTNPASAAMLGFQVQSVPSDARGFVDLDALDARLSKNTAAIMLTNPNTLGIFDSQVLEVTRRVHDAGGLLYYDGANLNALLGITTPGALGFDIVHLNMHKTFSIPHGGGGPGAGPVGVKAPLRDFLPVPLAAQAEDGSYCWDYDLPHTVGKVKAYHGHFLNLVRGLVYILAHGPDGLRRIAEDAVLNANYLLSQLKDDYGAPYPGYCKHEFVLSASRQKALGVRALDIAKALLDYGFYAPTIYFPLTVDECLMIEPTETETKETLDAFAAAMRDIARRAESDPESLRQAPVTTPVRRLDEAGAARKPVLRWKREAAAKA